MMEVFQVNESRWTSLEMGVVYIKATETLKLDVAAYRKAKKLAGLDAETGSIINGVWRRFRQAHPELRVRFFQVRGA